MLLHQGRTAAAEDHAIRVAERIEPSMSRAPLTHLSVWGSLLLTAMAAAVAGGREGSAVDHLGLARSAAGRFEHERHDYNASFGPAQVAIHGTHAYATLRKPGRALALATHLSAGDVLTIAYGRHLLDVAQAHLDGHDLDGTQQALLEARSLSTEWFCHQGPARTLAAELVGEKTRLSPALRQLAGSVGVV
jgi:hypothetical protein